MADIFNAPSDDEDFLGFGHNDPRQITSSEDGCNSFDSLGSGKKVGTFYCDPRVLVWNSIVS